MAVLSDNTVSGAGDIAGYNPAPLSLYYIVTAFGFARTHDALSAGRWFDLGYVVPYFSLDPVGLGTQEYLFEPVFLQFNFGGIQWHQFAGGLDGFLYNLGPGVQVRLILTDD